MIPNGPVAARHGLLPLDLLSDASGPALRRPRVGSMTSSHHRWPRPCPICTPMCNASAMQCACRRTRGSPFWALGCGQAGRRRTRPRSWVKTGAAPSDGGRMSYSAVIRTQPLVPVFGIVGHARRIAPQMTHDQDPDPSNGVKCPVCRSGLPVPARRPRI